MAVDGSVDIAPILEKERVDKRIHDGSDYAEGHAEFEAAMGEIFGIELGTSITKSIFGEFGRGGYVHGVQADGSFTFVRFSRSSSVATPANAVGWEFSDGHRRVRFVQVSGMLQLWWWNGTEWEFQINFEDSPETALTDLEDVLITPAQLNEANIGLCPKVMAGGNWSLGEDTTVSGAQRWQDLTDTGGTLWLDYGMPGSVWMTDGVGQIDPHLLPGDVKIATSFYLLNKEIVTIQPGFLTGWIRDPYGEDQGFEAISINPNDPEEFLFPSPGVYKMIFSYSNVSGSTEVDSIYDNSVLMSYLTKGLGVCRSWPPFPTYIKDEVWFEIYTIDYPRVLPEGYNLVQLFQDPDGAEHGQHVFYFVTSGGDVSHVALGLVTNLVGGNRIMNFHVSFERVS